MENSIFFLQGLYLAYYVKKKQTPNFCRHAFFIKNIYPTFYTYLIFSLTFLLAFFYSSILLLFLLLHFQFFCFIIILNLTYDKGKRTKRGRRQINKTKIPKWHDI